MLISSIDFTFTQLQHITVFVWMFSKIGVVIIHF